MLAVIGLLILVIVVLVIFGGWRMALAYKGSKRAKALGERAVTEMRLRYALEDQLAEERERRIQLENELAEFKEDH
jgi:uncharacterized membrane protein|tara:strand:+ start:635 stop:862 length:228 start_codon:yes stop_codon:yes gene_type:complete